MPETILYQETWQTLKTNSGISGPANVDITPWGATSRDADYPDIGLTDTIKVVNNGSRNVLAANTNWLNAGVVFDRNLGAVAGNGNYPTYLDANRRLFYYADYTITSASVAANNFPILVAVHLVVGGTECFGFHLNDAGGGTWLVDVFAALWNEADIADDSVTLTDADLIDKRLRFKVDYTPGTMDAPGNTVQDDGTIIFSMIDLDTDVETVLYTYTNKSLWLTYNGLVLGGGSTVPANNHIAVASVGYAGLIGENEQFVIAAPADASAPDPEPGELMGTTPDPCCGGSGGSGTGPILPALDVAWTAVCTGGGTVPTAADLTDAENWDD